MLELEKALKERCAADPQYETLLAQWTFDKQLVGRALQSIPLLFPHYSSHDSSHSDTILRQIARVLGPRRIEKLGPTDLWLLLEAAYHHDLGMVIPDQMMRKWWAEKEFKSFLDGLETHSDEEIRRSAELLARHDNAVAQNETWPFEVHRALVLVMAEYARPRHSGQSRRYAETPLLLDLRSPRTHLVPRRFWNLLGRICECHGLSFGETMKLPARESGYSMDDAHPRFIACMLRLGDLLDVDDGRFCPILARTFGGLPQSSKVHEEKHHSIEEFLVDASEIRVVAECCTPDAFDVTEQWFSWIRQELRDQSVHWSSISPLQDFGAVPSAGRIEARLRDYHTSPDGRRPRFEVDKESMLDFVRGAGLYTDETACVAELLQNAVDATLLRVWKANPAKWKRIHEQEGDRALETLREHLVKYPIDVRVSKSKRLEGENLWTVEIRDRGAGISMNDVRFIQSVGSSRKNLRRVSRTRDMPEWMKPAGYFGIGLQSVFLFTDQVVLRSRADDSMETIELDLTQRRGSKEPQILVRSVSGSQAMNRSGTLVRFTLREPAVPEKIGIRIYYQETIRVIRDFDPLLSDELPILPSKIRDAVRKFAGDALASIRLDGIVVKPDENQPDLEVRDRFFDANESVEIAPKACRGVDGEFLYRGRNTAERVNRRFLSMNVSWHRDDAAKILTISREQIRIEAKKTVDQVVDRVALKILPRYYEKIVSDPDRAEELMYLSLAVRVNSEYESIRSRFGEHWKDLHYDPAKTVTLAQLLNTPRVCLTTDSRWSADVPGLRDPKIEWSEDGQAIVITRDKFEEWFWEVLSGRHLILQEVERTSEGDGRHERVRIKWLALSESAGSEDIIESENALREILREASNRNGGVRRTIPCAGRFRAMAFSSQHENELRPVRAVYHRLAPRALFPFQVRPDGLSFVGIERLIRWTFEHRLDRGVTERDIAQAVLDLAQATDEMLTEELADRKDYDIAGLRRLLSKAYGL